MSGLDLPVTAPPIDLYAGDDAVREYTLTGPDGLIDFTPFELTCEARRYSSSPPVAVPVSSPNPGELKLSFSAALTRDLPSSGTLDVQGVSAGGTLTFLRANFTVRDDITRGLL